MKIHLLDMGRPKYGDCILITEGDHKILIDGGHPGDAASLRRQLTKLLQSQPPFAFNLLIVTHCHADHIGCLPELVASGSITAKVALVADETLGWGRTGTNDGQDEAPTTTLSDNQQILALALQEEDRSDMSDEDIEQFLFDVMLLEDSYKKMLEQLKAAGTKITRYGKHTAQNIKDVERAAKPVKLKILGPTQEHLTLCAHAITGSSGGDDALQDVAADASMATLTELYRSMAGRSQRDAVSRFSEDSPGVGAAKNNQSIVISVEAPANDGKWKALLAGDMQFAKPEVRNLEGIMEELLKTVNHNGPYDFIKLTHHSSYNGTDDVILSEWNKHTKLFAHTGGWNDAAHPEGGVLRILEEKARALMFTRTDHNGIITLSKQDGELGFEISKGEYNDFSPNLTGDEKPAVAPQLQPEASSVVMEKTVDAENGMVEVTAKVPHQQTRVTITIEVEPSKKKITDAAPRQNITVDQTETERFSGLLFITAFKELSGNIPAATVEKIKGRLQGSGVAVIDIPSASLATAESAAAVVRQKLISGIYKGVVILGGYDIVPAQILDVLSPALREELKLRRRIESDADDFIVWSDDLYGDVDGNGDPEIPVCRIPDGKDADLLLQALSAPRFAVTSRFGIRNLARPFAQNVYQAVPGKINNLEVSESFAPHQIIPDSARGAVYYMLHGSDKDATRFWGETADEDEFEAFTIDNIPASANGSVVFTGCCWGALTAEPTAFKKAAAIPMRSRKPNESIALKYLQAGALAFVGCTGSHYSPRQQPYNYHGKPLHDGFWKGIREGKSPAQALFEAKSQYKKEYPHGQTTPFSKAIELKILRQFTLIGLGW